MDPASPPPTAWPVPLPYPEASSWQQRRAVFSVSQLLEPAFPYLTLADWRRVFDAVQPGLYVLADQVLFTHGGLAQVVHYAATARLAAPPRPVTAAPPPTTGRKGSRRGATPLSPLKEQEAALLQQLTNVSYWRSQPRRQVTAEVVELGLRHFTDAQRPRPPEEPF